MGDLRSIPSSPFPVHSQTPKPKTIPKNLKVTPRIKSNIPIHPPNPLPLTNKPYSQPTVSKQPSARNSSFPHSHSSLSTQHSFNQSSSLKQINKEAFYNCDSSLSKPRPLNQSTPPEQTPTKQKSFYGSNSTFSNHPASKKSFSEKTSIPKNSHSHSSPSNPHAPTKSFFSEKTSIPKNSPQALISF